MEKGRRQRSTPQFKLWAAVFLFKLATRNETATGETDRDQLAAPIALQKTSPLGSNVNRKGLNELLDVTPSGEPRRDCRGYAGRGLNR